MKVKYSYLAEQFQDHHAIFESIDELIKSGDYTLGKPVQEFEKKFAKLIDTKYAVGVNSGTDALFLSLYKTSQIHGKEFTKKMVTLIDSFYIVAYDFVVGACYKGETPFFLKMWDEVINLNKKKKKNEEAYGQLMNQLNEIEKTRNVARGIYEERLSFGHWAVLIILSGIILFSIFYLKTDALFSMVITILLSTALVLILLLIRDLQNFMLGGNSLLEESGEEVFEYIGKPRYYNNLYLKGGINKLPKNIMEYRIGYHKPGANKFNIKLIKK